MAYRIFEHNAKSLNISFERKLLSAWTDEIFEWLFCIHPDYENVDVFLAKEKELQLSLIRFIEQTNPINIHSKTCTDSFFKQLPVIHELLKGDLETFYNSDPAARSVEEVLLAYPGFFAVSVYRLAHELWISEVPVLPRLLSEHAHSVTGIDIHPGATIGKKFLIDHGTGVVIGETSHIGDEVKIYQGVTLGALSVSRESASTKRHPTIGNRVVIYANATILGGNTVIGDDSVIGGNVWITQSIPSYSLVFHKSEIIIKDNSTFPEPLNFVI